MDTDFSWQRGDYFDVLKQLCRLSRADLSTHYNLERITIYSSANVFSTCNDHWKGFIESISSNLHLLLYYFETMHYLIQLDISHSILHKPERTFMDRFHCGNHTKTYNFNTKILVIFMSHKITATIRYSFSDITAFDEDTTFCRTLAMFAPWRSQNTLRIT